MEERIKKLKALKEAAIEMHREAYISHNRYLKIEHRIQADIDMAKKQKS